MTNSIRITCLLLSILLFLGCNNDNKLKTFLIPLGYTGPLRVVFDENCGTKPDIENGRQVFQFQNNGIIILKSEFFNADSNDNFYFVDKNNKKTEITQILTEKERVIGKSSILLGEITVSYYEPLQVNNNEVKGRGVTHQDFYLYDKNSPVNKENISSNLDSLTKLALKACKEKR